MILVALWANVAACGASFYNINKIAGTDSILRNTGPVLIKIADFSFVK